jgi:Sigma-70 region 2
VGEGFSGRFADTATEGPGDADLARARAGDNAAFGRLVAPLRRELHAHCYRMLGSTHDADDALQDALLRGWRADDRARPETAAGRPAALVARLLAITHLDLYFDLYLTGRAATAIEAAEPGSLATPPVLEPAGP